MTHRAPLTGPLVAVSALVAVTVVAELALHRLAPITSPYDQIDRLKPEINQYIRFEYPPRYAALTEAEPGLPGLSGFNHFTTNNMGFRGDSLADPKPPREFRVFLVGGSTVECFYLDDADDVARIVQRELRARAPDGVDVRVYNAGLSGAASDDHVAMVSQRLVHLQPDLLVVLCGINDLTRSIYDYDYRHYIEYRPAYRKPWYKRLPMASQIGRRLYYFQLRFRPDAARLLEHRALKTNYAGAVGLMKTMPPSDAPPRTDEKSYRTNLRSLVGLARANRFALVFVTQQTTWNSPVDPTTAEHQWMRCRRDVVFGEDQMDAAMERLNDVMRAVGREDSVPVYDLARSLPKSSRYFYDDCHFNMAGAATAGAGLSAFLVEYHLVAVAQTP